MVKVSPVRNDLTSAMRDALKAAWQSNQNGVTAARCGASDATMRALCDRNFLTISERGLYYLTERGRRYAGFQWGNNSPSPI